MAHNVTVTPGYTFADGETVTEAKLNALGLPGVVVTGDDGNGMGANLFSNPDLSIWQRGAGPVSCPRDESTFLADHWFVRPRRVSGGLYDAWVAYYQKEADVVYNDELYRARFGFSSLTGTIAAEMEFGQRRLARVTCKLANTFLVQCEIENQTGTAFRPKARIYTCATADTFGTTTAQETVDGNAASGSNTLGNGERRLYYFTFTAAGYDAALKMGGEVCIVIPDPAAAAGYVRIYGQLKLENGITPTVRLPERDASGEATSAGTGTGVANYLLNGEFAMGLFASRGAAVNVTTAEASVAHGWLAQTAAGTAVFQADATEFPNHSSNSSLKITGAVGVDVLTLRQRIYRGIAGTARRSLVFSAWIRNYTTASLTPTLRVLGCNAADNFDSMTLLVTQALTPIGNGDWVRVSHTFDPLAYAQFNNGAVIELTFPAGSLNANTKTVRVAQASLVPGLALADWVASPDMDAPAPLATWRNLKITRDFALPYEADITCDEIVLVTKDGRARTYKNVSVHWDISSSGLDTGSVANDTEYYLYLAANDFVDINAVASTSATRPAGWEDYPFQARISNFKTWPNTHSDFGGLPVIPFQFQRDKVQAYFIEAGSVYLAAEYTPVATTTTTIAVTGIPSTAVALAGHAGVVTGGGDPCCLDISTDSNNFGFQRIVIPNAQLWNDIQAGGSFRVPVAQTANLYLTAQNSAAQEYAVCINQIEIA